MSLGGVRTVYRPLHLPKPAGFLITLITQRKLLEQAIKLLGQLVDQMSLPTRGQGTAT